MQIRTLMAQQWHVPKPATMSVGCMLQSFLRARRVLYLQIPSYKLQEHKSPQKKRAGRRRKQEIGKKGLWVQRHNIDAFWRKIRRGEQ